MNQTQEYFISLLNSYINNEPVNVRDDINYGELLKISKLQNFTAIIFDILRKNIPSPYYKLFENDYNATVFSNVNRNTLIKNINRVFNDSNIKYFIVKGVKIAELYPNPLLRTMGDTDMIMSSEDRIKADSLMINNLKFNKLANGNEWIYVRNNIEFELHDSLLYEEYKEKGYLNSFWNYVSRNGHNYELDWSFHFVFLIAHLKKHILFEGAGFRQFLDIALVTNKITTLNWQYITNTLSDLDLYDFARTVLTLNNLWFSSKNPLGNKELDKDFIKEVTNRIFEFGVFGHDNPDSQTNKMINKGGSKIKFILESIFPSKRVLFTHQYMNYFIDKPLLLPIAYIYRWFYLIKTRAKDITRVLFASQEKLNKRNDELKNWGLK